MQRMVEMIHSKHQFFGMLINISITLLKKPVILTGFFFDLYLKDKFGFLLFTKEFILNYFN